MHRCIRILAGLFFRAPTISSLRAVNFGRGGRNRRIKSTIKARVVVAVLAVFCIGSAFTAHAQNATWNPGATSDWNTVANWTPATVPTGTATFGVPGVKSITFPQPTTIGTLQFNAPGYLFEIPFTGVQGVSITGSGVESTLANAPTFDVPGGFYLLQGWQHGWPGDFHNSFHLCGRSKSGVFPRHEHRRTGENY